MADPFEVRMRFTSQLQHLNASTTSALKAANYALKYSEFSDDLHSCILEQLEQGSTTTATSTSSGRGGGGGGAANLNNRANIMYFLPALCDAARAHGDPAYVRMIERDILRIIDLVAPDDRSGAANVKVVRKVLAQMQAKQFLLPQTVRELEECIAGREGGDHDAPSSPPPTLQQQQQQQPVQHPATAVPPASAAALEAGGNSVNADGTVSAARSTPLSTSAGGTAQREQTYSGHHHQVARLDKRQIEQRIEEDRERHKRAREGIWAIPQVAGGGLADDAEFERMCDELSDAGEDDFVRAKEEVEERKRCLEFEEA